MLLPKRVIHRNKVKGKPTLRQLVGSISTADRYFLDDENVIVVINNPDKKSKNHYITIHYRLIEGELVEINRWYHRSYYFGPHDADVIKELNLFMVQGGHGVGTNSHKCHHAIYHYKLDKFIVPDGEFDCIGTTNHVAGMSYHVDGPNYLKEYGCFLAYFSLSSTYKDGDIISYQNPVTMEQMLYNFNHHELYFALLNTDGTIRGNKLFKGENFSRVDTIIDLDNYSSLKEFKQERIKILNYNKHQEQLAYYQKLTTNDDSISPYLDKEVLNVLKLVNKK